MSTNIEYSDSATNGVADPVPCKLDGIVTIVLYQKGVRCTTVYRMTRPTDQQWDIISRGVNGTLLEKECAMFLLRYYRQTKDRTDWAEYLRQKTIVRDVKKLRTLEKVEVLFDDGDSELVTGFAETRPVKYAMIVISRYDEVLAFATNAHKGQFRKGGLPYITHPVAVAEMLRDLGEEVIHAALLHDVVEDTSVTIEDIRMKFGDVVADLVAEVTDNPALRGAERRRVQFEKAEKLSMGAAAIKLADMAHNLSCRLDSNCFTHEENRVYFAWKLVCCKKYDHWYFDSIPYLTLFEKVRLIFKDAAEKGVFDPSVPAEF